MGLGRPPEFQLQRDVDASLSHGDLNELAVRNHRKMLGWGVTWPGDCIGKTAMVAGWRQGESNQSREGNEV